MNCPKVPTPHKIPGTAESGFIRLTMASAPKRRWHKAHNATFSANDSLPLYRVNDTMDECYSQNTQKQYLNSFRHICSL